MTTELVRYRCPRCGAVYDVWLENGHPEKAPYCPSCRYVGQFDRDETKFFEPRKDHWP